MPNYAHITIVGHVGRDPESDTTSGGAGRCRFSVAVNTKAGGEDATTWYNVTAFGYLSDFAANYVTKGQAVLVEGKFSLREYQGRDGTTKTSPDVTANDIQLLSGRDDSEGGGGEYRKTSRTTNAATNAGPPKSASRSTGKGATRSAPAKPRDDDDSSLPF